ncbi:MAG TPA: protein kinase [Polyangiaceae bacterium]|nr:protein kinase [Polyangiaceae bacterium]
MIRSRSLATPGAQGSSNLPLVGEGSELLKRYRLVVRLGYGRATDVFLATREVTPLVTEPVVVKRLQERHSASPELVQRFLRESAVLRGLRHPRLVRILETGVVDGRCCLAEEYVEGQSLGQMLRRARESGGFSAQIAVFVAICALEGLHHAHEASDPDGRSLGIVHRNVSPHGVFVTNDGGVKLSDFNIADWFPGDVAPAAGARAGVPVYSAPEQDARAVVDRRADVWSVGVVLWEALTGKRPFGAEGDATRVPPEAKRTVVAPSSVRADVPAALDGIVKRALSRYAADRYGSALEMQRDLEQWLAGASRGDSAPLLAASMRRLFANEVVEQRRLVAVLRGADDPVPSSRSGSRILASTPANGATETPVNGPPTSRSPRPGSVPPPPPVPPLTPPPISRPPARPATGPMPSLPPPPMNPTAPTEAAPERTHDRVGSETLRALAIEAEEEDANVPPSEEDDDEPRARPFDYRSLIVVAALCAGFSVLATSVVIWSLRGRPAQPEATAIEARERSPANAPREQPASAAERTEAPPSNPVETASNATFAATPTPPAVSPAETKTMVAAPEPPEPSEPINDERVAVARAPALSAAARDAPHTTGAGSPRHEAPSAKVETPPPAPPDDVTAKHDEPAPPAPTTPEPPEPGFLTVDTTPWSVVSENGKLLGQTPLVHLELASGTHVLVLKNPELGIQTSYTVTIQPGKTVVKRIGIE